MTKSQSETRHDSLETELSREVQAICSAVAMLSNTLVARLDSINDTLNDHLANLNQKLDQMIEQTGETDVY